MAAVAREKELLDRLWERVEPLLPPKPAHPKGGHPFCDDKECFAGIVYQLRNGIRWNDMPKCFPSSSTCWRRHRDWCLAGVWESIWLIVLEELEAAGMLDMSELFLDATFAEAQKGGACIGATKCGKGVKIEIVTDAQGIPIGMATDAASVPEVEMAGPAVAGIPASVEIPAGTPLIGDKAYDSDPLREELAEDGFILISPHRDNRTKPPTNDGRRLRRYQRRWTVERTFAWLHSYRRVVIRYERNIGIYDGFVYLACAFICINKLL